MVNSTSGVESGHVVHFPHPYDGDGSKLGHALETVIRYRPADLPAERKSATLRM